ncbi:DNA gyrase inhibitor YacG [Chitinibacter bivalviorum]|uniref:DNA gyrase inhibitor YacG n=1 Tax=Chitinibacter bivalviorum TaxID=2739434 RepID=A0A7H9BKZ0_9NEIS|nr:DNA gyrase inhibitor YacG [Chitinibacter bivalviorum]QLG88681.1 DNA gyrase inhibitor YacG [Chitinibacter bivalviorum]
MSDTLKQQVKCPQCGCLNTYSPTNPSRPFCSERCKLIDLGQWANENYRIAEETQSIDINTLSQ